MRRSFSWSQLEPLFRLNERKDPDSRYSGSIKGASKLEHRTSLNMLTEVPQDCKRKHHNNTLWTSSLELQPSWPPFAGLKWLSWTWKCLGRWNLSKPEQPMEVRHLSSSGFKHTGPRKQRKETAQLLQNNPRFVLCWPSSVSSSSSLSSAVAPLHLLSFSAAAEPEGLQAT